MTGSFWLRIDGDPRSIDAQALPDAVSALLVMLGDTGIEGFVIQHLKLSSIEMSFAPRLPGDYLEQFDRLSRSLGALAAEDVPDDATPALLDGVVDLFKVRQRAGVTGIRLGVDQERLSELEQATYETARQALATTSVSHGAVRGRIHRFLDHKSRREVSIEDQAEGRSVRVTFTRDQEALILEAVNKEVLAWGDLRRDRFGRKVSLRLQNFDIVVPASTPSDGRGLLGKDWVASDSVSAVRAQRG